PGSLGRAGFYRCLDAHQAHEILQDVDRGGDVIRRRFINRCALLVNALGNRRLYLLFFLFVLFFVFIFVFFVFFVVFLVLIVLILDLEVVFDGLRSTNWRRWWSGASRHADARGLTAKAQEARAPLAQYFDIDLFSSQAQLFQGLLGRFINGPAFGLNAFHDRTSFRA